MTQSARSSAPVIALEAVSAAPKKVTVYRDDRDALAVRIQRRALARRTLGSRAQVRNIARAPDDGRIRPVEKKQQRGGEPDCQRWQHADDCNGGGNGRHNPKVHSKIESVECAAAFAEIDYELTRPAIHRVGGRCDHYTSHDRVGNERNRAIETVREPEHRGGECEIRHGGAAPAGVNHSPLFSGRRNQTRNAAGDSGVACDLKHRIGKQEKVQNVQTEMGQHCGLKSAEAISQPISDSRDAPHHQPLPST